MHRQIHFLFFIAKTSEVLQLKLKRNDQKLFSSTSRQPSFYLQQTNYQRESQ